MDLQLPKGVRDFPPEEKLLRDQIIKTLKEEFEKYGFSPLETPIFERFEILSAKYAGGAEILKETFKFKDQGDRLLGLRYDLTVPFARFIGMNPQLKMPFKRYAIGRVFRDGPIKIGRYREFYQCDVDVVGNKNLMAEAELMILGVKIFKKLKIPVKIYFNNRVLLEELIRSKKVPEEKIIDAMLIIDKLKKKGLEGVKEELAEKGIEPTTADLVTGFSDFSKTNEERIRMIKEKIGETEGSKKVEELLSYINAIEEIKNEIIFDPSLARGLSYYTGTIFEGFTTDPDSPVKSAVCGGGRYDKMIGNMLGSKIEYPAVGISFGLEPITEIIKYQNRKENQEVRRTVTQAVIIPIKDKEEGLRTAEKLRDRGVRTDLLTSKKGVTKGLEYADSYNIPFSIIIGPQEKEKGVVKIKNMITGDEKEATIDEAAKMIKEFTNSQ